MNEYLLLVHDDTIELGGETLHALLGGETVLGTDLGSLGSALGDTATRARQVDVEVHTVDTGRRVVLETEIDMFGDTEAEGTILSEVTLFQFVFLNLQTLLEDLLGLLTTDGHRSADLLITTDTEVSVGEAGLSEDRLLFGQLFQHLGGTGQSVTGFTDTDRKGQFLNANGAHGIIVVSALVGVVS